MSEPQVTTLSGAVGGVERDGVFRAEAGHAHQPKISYGTLTYVAETDAKAIERARVHIPNAYHTGAGLPNDDGGARADQVRKTYQDRGEPETAEMILHARDVDWLLENNLIWVGSPDTVIEQIATAAAESPFNVANAELNYGYMQPTEQHESVVAFAEAVIPKLRDLKVC